MNSDLESDNQQMMAFDYILIETLVQSMRAGVQCGLIASLLSVWEAFCLKLHQCKCAKCQALQWEGHKV